MPDNYQPYNPEDLQDLENKGWMQMQKMLNKHLPEEAPVRKIGIAPIWKWLAAACIILGLAVPLVMKLNNKPVLSNNDQATKLIKPDSLNNVVTSKGKSDTTSGLNGAMAQKEASNINNKNDGTPSIASISTDSVDKKLADKNITVNKDAPSLEKFTDGKRTAPQIVGNTNRFDSSKLQAVAIKPSNTLPLASNTKKDSSRQIVIAQNTKPSSEQKTPKPEKPYWPEEEHEDNNAKHRYAAKSFDLALLLNRNTNAQQRTGNSLYDIPAYPSVTASVRISKSVGITTGLTANAPGNFNLSPNGGTTAMNLASPTANSKPSSLMYASSSASYLTQAYYWQVPLTFDYFPVKNVKLYAGANLAFVQKVLLTEQTTTVNAAAMSPSVRTTNTPVLKSNSAYEASVNDNGTSYTLRQFDPRMTVGGFYQVKSLILGVQYSRAIQPSLMQRSADLPNSNNSIVNFSVGIKLFDKHK